MEENQNQEPSLFGMEVDPDMQEQLNSISKWSKFIAITGIISGAIFLIAIIAGGKRIMDAIDKLMPLGNRSEVMWVIVIVLVIFGGLCAVWIYFLLQSSELIRKGLYTRSSDSLADGFRALRNYFTISIILSALSIVSTLFTLGN